MATTWRRRDLERRSGQRSRLLRLDLILPVLALIVAGIALWQALAAQSRAELLAHDLSVANSRLRNIDTPTYPPGSAAPAAATPDAEAPLPPLPSPPLGGPASH